MKKIMNKYAISGVNVFSYTEQEGDVVDKLPVAYYKLQQHPMFGPYLEKKGENLAVPDLIYGSTEKRAELIINTFNRKEDAMGVALFGSKGAGKTLLSNVLANKSLAQGMPVVDLTGTVDFNAGILDFVNGLGSCMIILDEFFKNLMNRDNSESNSTSNDLQNVEKAQNRMLTFFSATNNAKRLTVIIDNNSQFLNDFFRNRPSRLRYIFNYNSVESEVVKALCKKEGLSEDMESALVTYATKNCCTFDMINELIDEVINQPVLEEVNLVNITSYMNVPSCYNKVMIKLRVAAFSCVDSTEGWSLVNGIAEQSGSTIYVSVQKPSIFFTEPNILEHDEYEAKYKDEDGDTEYSYSTYLKMKEKPTMERNISFDTNSLTKILGDSATYSDNYFTVEVVDDIEVKQVNSFYY